MESVQRLFLWFLFLALACSPLSYGQVLLRPNSWIWRPVIFTSTVVLCVMPKTVIANNHFLELPLEESSLPEPKQQRRRHQRDVDLRAIPWNAGFIVKFTTGPKEGPNQELSLKVDTGSELTWAPHRSICPDTNTCPLGFYDEHGVPTHKWLVKPEPERFRIDFLGFPTAAGRCFSDEVHLPGADIANFPMGLSYEPPPSDHEIWPTLGMRPFPPGTNFSRIPIFPEVLKERHIIESVAYSMWMPPGPARGRGSILFGAIDTSKFSGRLVIVDAPDLHVQVDSIRVPSSKDPVSTEPFTALVDSGSNPTVLPQYLIDRMVPHFPGAVFDPKNGMYTVQCPGDKLSGVTFSFGFGDGDNFVIEVDRDHFSAMNPSGECVLLLLPTTPKLPTMLGAAFFRATYLVFDLANLKLGIGQGVNAHTPPNIIPFESDGAPIPSVGIEVCTEEHFKGECAKYTGNSRVCIPLHPDHESKIHSARAIVPNTHCSIATTVERKEDYWNCLVIGKKGIDFEGYGRIDAGWFGDNSTIEGFVCYTGNVDTEKEEEDLQEQARKANLESEGLNLLEEDPEA